MLKQNVLHFPKRHNRKKQKTSGLVRSTQSHPCQEGKCARARKCIDIHMHTHTHRATNTGLNRGELIYLFLSDSCVSIYLLILWEGGGCVIAASGSCCPTEAVSPSLREQQAFMLPCCSPTAKGHGKVLTWLCFYIFSSNVWLFFYSPWKLCSFVSSYLHLYTWSQKAGMKTYPVIHFGVVLVYLNWSCYRVG